MPGLHAAVAACMLVVYVCDAVALNMNAVSDAAVVMQKGRFLFLVYFIFPPAV